MLFKIFIFLLGSVSGIAGCNTRATYSTIFDNHCYWIIQTKQDITLSQTLCATTGGFLAIIPDENTLNMVDNFIDSTPYFGEFYMGYDISTSVLTTFYGETQSWAPWHSTTHSSASHCVYLYNRKFYSSTCDRSKKAICSDHNTLGSGQGSIETTENIANDSATTTLSDSTIDGEGTRVTSTAATIAADRVTSLISTSDEHMSITIPTTTQDMQCQCLCSMSSAVYINDTEQLNEKLSEIKKELYVEKSSLSSTVRKKISAADERPSATGVGVIGIFLLSLVFAPIVLSDLLKCFNFIRNEISMYFNRKVDDYCLDDKDQATE